MKNKNIVVIGSYLVALVMDTDRIPLTGETVLARNFRQTHGGKGSNQAVQAARLGANTSFVGRIGKDAFGESFIKLCELENVNAEFVFQSTDMPTGAGFIICDELGFNVITIDIAAINQFSRKDIDTALSLITDNSIVLLQLEIPLDTALYAAEKAKQKGAIVILNPAPAQNLMGYDLSMIDILTPNETEAKICAGLVNDAAYSDEEVAQQLLSLGCKNILVTLGEKGSFLCNSSVAMLIPSISVNEVIDTTGAGDAFNAGLAVALSEGKIIMEAAQFANVVGGLSVTKSDTIPSYHFRAQVQEYMDRSAHV
ncbi:ribokinase [Pedobacter frigiditerrae]|uniref:Ribokinase n=1 Tax=Pedobacter frigiditerrae TaxID=2530452 RepID=A0A4R0MPH5_9SPHI|nr:ribokinase [Pedobacter frigiditerrae]TCC88710.1 ribokinase [Pedobacter frigiditerrae]